HHGEQVEPHAAGVLVALLDAEFAAHLALRQLSVLAGARTLAGEKQEIAGAYRVHIVCYRRRHLAELDAELRETLFGAHEETTLPGFMRLSGSKRRLMPRITSSTSSPSSARSDACLPMPTPCSPVQVPSRRSARSTRRRLNSLASSVSSGF